MGKPKRAKIESGEPVKAKRVVRPRREAIIKDVVRPRSELYPADDTEKTQPLYMVFTRIIDTETCNISGWRHHQTVSDPDDRDGVVAEYKTVVSEVGYSGIMGVTLVRIDGGHDFRSIPGAASLGKVVGRVLTSRVSKSLRETMGLTKGESYGRWDLQRAATGAWLAYLDGHADSVIDGYGDRVHHSAVPASNGDQS